MCLKLTYSHGLLPTEDAFDREVPAERPANALINLRNSQTDLSPTWAHMSLSRFGFITHPC